MIFDPATSSWEDRAKIAEQLLTTLCNSIEGFARDNDGKLPHRINLPFSVASNHVRVIQEYEHQE